MQYNPNNSQLSDTNLADFLRSEITGDLLEVPGISNKQIILLNRGGDITDQITNTHQLIGKFLMLKMLNENTNKPITSQEHCDKFLKYLKNKGITSHRNDIVMAIAEKTNTMFPGLYDPYIYN